MRASTWRVLATLLLLYATCAALWAGFRGPRVPLNLLTDQATLGVLALGQTIVILAGGIDLSIGALMALASVIIATLVPHGWHPLAAIALVVAMGAMAGALMGWLVDRLRLPAFLVTLAAMFAFRGLALRMQPGARAIEHPWLTAWSASGLRLHESHQLGLLQLGTGALVWCTATACAAWWLCRARSGRNLYALGGSETAALLMGVPITATRVLAFALCSGCAALAGALLTIYGSAADPNAGVGLELEAIAAAVIGGTSLRGGIGSAAGTFVGVLLLGLVYTMLGFAGVSSSGWLRIAVGGLLLAALVVQRLLALGALRARGTRCP